MKIAQWGCRGALFLVAFAMLGSVARGQDRVRAFEKSLQKTWGFRRMIMELALGVSKKLPPGEKGLVIGEFTGSAKLGPTNGGPGIQRALIEELARLDIRPDRKAAWELKGDYGLSEQPAAKETLGHFVFRVNARLYAQGKDEVTELTPVKWYLYKGDRGWDATLNEVARLLGMTAAPTWYGDKTNPKRWFDGLKWDPDQPQVVVRGTRIRSTSASPYAVEILVKDDPKGPAQASLPRIENGQAYVPIRKNQYFEVRCINRTKYKAAVTLAIDGLDQFTFCDLRDPRTGELPFTPMLILRVGSTYAIKGWYRTNKKADAFVVTTYAKSAAAKQLTSSAQVGTITVTFAAAWPQGEPAPADEPPEPRYLGAELGTGRGPEVQTRLRTTTLPNIGVVRDVITVRYTR
jgi:hypothetical protein